MNTAAVEPRYPINVFWHDDDQCWIADIPDLKSCAAHGDTPDEALREVQIAMSGWLAVARDYGYPIPQPSSPPPKFS